MSLGGKDIQLKEQNHIMLVQKAKLLLVVCCAGALKSLQTFQLFKYRGKMNV